MQKGLKWIFTCGSVMALLLFSACGMSYDGQEEEQGLPQDTGDFQQIAELFTDTVNGETGFISTRFHINDRKYWSQNGFTVWTLWDDPPEPEFTSTEVKVSKPSGNRYAGYGLVLCYGMQDVEGSQIPMMLTVMINNNGQYALGKVTAGRYESLEWWTSHTAIQPNAGPVNTINVSMSRDVNNNAVYTLKVNGISVKQFFDGDPPHLTGGKTGYIVVISPLDEFPKTEVDILFERTL
jgi:hypothetical protein